MSWVLIYKHNFYTIIYCYSCACMRVVQLASLALACGNVRYCCEVLTLQAKPDYLTKIKA